MFTLVRAAIRLFRAAARVAVPSACRCLCGCGRVAESPEASVFQLAEVCADARFPGTDSVAYMRLVDMFGYK